MKTFQLDSKSHAPTECVQKLSNRKQPKICHQVNPKSYQKGKTDVKIFHQKLENWNIYLQNL